MDITDLLVYTALVLAAIGCHLLLTLVFSVNRGVSLLLSPPLGAASVAAALYIVYSIASRR